MGIQQNNQTGMGWGLGLSIPDKEVSRMAV
jgi:hypothetical protein